MATHGRGLICTPLIEERCDELGLEMMVDSNNSPLILHLQFPLILLEMVVQLEFLLLTELRQCKPNKNLKPKDLGKPGHIFP